MINAATNNYVTNTDGFNFGFYYSAQVVGEGVAFWAINRSTAVYSTTVGTNGPTAPLLNGGTMPAIYAQAYQGDIRTQRRKNASIWTKTSATTR